MTDFPAPAWRKSSHSNDVAECVEVAAFPSATIGIRDSKNPHGPELIIGRRELRALLTRIKSGA